MKQTKVGFLLEDLLTFWNGGLHYYQSLLESLRSLERPLFSYTVFASTRLDRRIIESFPTWHITQSKSIGDLHPAWEEQRKWDSWFGPDGAFDLLLESESIAAMFHCGYLSGSTKVRGIGWIPDFQHREWPQFFSQRERVQRDEFFERLAERSTVVVLSSATMLDQFQRYYPKHASKGRIYRFCALKRTIGKETEAWADTVAADGPFFLVANQFWAHKNHGLILDALDHARKKCPGIRVIATGAQTDYRFPNYFSEFRSRISTLGLEKNFLTLGDLSHEHVLALMKRCRAVINASFCEGWSTAVEEARILGVRCLLSRIPVHIEQGPDGTELFDPSSPEELSRLLEDFLSKGELRTLKPVHYEALLKRCGAQFESIIEAAL